MIRDKKLTVVINTLAVAVPLLVALLLGMNKEADKIDLGNWTKSLPHVIGIINTLTSIVLIFALVAIKKQKPDLHRKLMYVALSLGSLFLLTYVTYHMSNPSTSFGGTGALKVVYLVLLTSHIVLSIGVVWFVLMALKYALLGDFQKHTKIVKIAYPLWLYVSVTGVIVYLLIRPYYV